MYLCTKISKTMQKVLAENVRRLCKQQGIQQKDLAAKIGIDPASLTRAINGNARLYTIERIASALGVSVKSLLDDADVEGFIKIRGNIYQFNSLIELMKLYKSLL